VKTCCFAFDECKYCSDEKDVCVVFNDSRPIQVTLSEGELRVNFVSKVDYTAELHNKWMGFFNEVVYHGTFQEDNINKILIDLSFVKSVEIYPVMSLSVILYSVKSSGIPVELKMPQFDKTIDYSSLQGYKIGRYLLNIGFFKFLEDNSIKYFMQYEELTYSQQVYSSCFSKSNQFYGLLHHLCVVDLAKIEFDEYINVIVETIEGNLRVLSVPNKEKYRILTDLKRVLFELLENVLLHAYQDVRKPVAFFIEYFDAIGKKRLNGTKLQISSSRNSSPGLKREFVETVTDCIDAYVLDLGCGFVTHLFDGPEYKRKNELVNAFRSTFMRGIRSEQSTSNRENLTKVSGLKIVGDTLKKNSGFLLLRDNREWLGTKIPYDNSNGHGDGSYGKIRNNDYNHMDLKGFFVQARIPARKKWSSKEIDSTLLYPYRVGAEFEKEVLLKPIEMINQKKSMYIDVRYPTIKGKVTKGNPLLAFCPGNMYTSPQDYCTATVKKNDRKLELYNSYYVFSYKNMMKNRIIKVIQNLYSHYNAIGKDVYFVDVAEEDLYIFSSAIDDFNLVVKSNDIDDSNIGCLHVVSDSLICKSFEIETKMRTAEENRSYLRFKYSHSLTNEFISSKELFKVQNSLRYKYSMEMKTLFNIKQAKLHSKVKWSNNLRLKGYLDFNNLKYDQEFTEIARKQILKIIAYYNRNLVTVKTLDANVESVCEYINEHYCSSEIGTKVAIGSVIVTGNTKERRMFGEELSNDYYLYSHPDGNQSDSSLFDWPYDSLEVRDISELNEVEFIRYKNTHRIQNILYTELFDKQLTNQQSKYLDSLQNVYPQYLKIGHKRIGNKHYFLHLGYEEIISDMLLAHNDLYEKLLMYAYKGLYLETCVKCKSDKILDLLQTDILPKGLLVVEQSALTTPILNRLSSVLNDDQMDYLHFAEAYNDLVSESRDYISYFVDMIYDKLLSFDELPKTVSFLFTEIADIETALLLKELLMKKYSLNANFMCIHYNSNDIDSVQTYLNIRAYWAIKLNYVGEALNCVLCNSLSRVSNVSNNFMDNDLINRHRVYISVIAKGQSSIYSFGELYKLVHDNSEIKINLGYVLKLILLDNMDLPTSEFDDNLHNLKSEKEVYMFAYIVRLLLYNHRLSEYEKISSYVNLLYQLMKQKSCSMYTAFSTMILLGLENSEFFRIMNSEKISKEFTKTEIINQCRRNADLKILLAVQCIGNKKLLEKYELNECMKSDMKISKVYKEIHCRIEGNSSKHHRMYLPRLINKLNCSRIKLMSQKKEYENWIVDLLRIQSEFHLITELISQLVMRDSFYSKMKLEELISLYSKLLDYSKIKYSHDVLEEFKVDLTEFRAQLQFLQEEIKHDVIKINSENYEQVFEDFNRDIADLIEETVKKFKQINCVGYEGIENTDLLYEYSDTFKNQYMFIWDRVLKDEILYLIDNSRHRPKEYTRDNPTDKYDMKIKANLNINERYISIQMINYSESDAKVVKLAVDQKYRSGKYHIEELGVQVIYSDKKVDDGIILKTEVRIPFCN